MYVILIMIARFIAAFTVGWYKSIKAATAAIKANTLCNTCANVHTVKGFGGKQLMFCNYTSELRAIKFAVCECTGYRDKNVAQAPRVAGFVRMDEINSGEAFPAIVVRIAPD